MTAGDLSAASARVAQRAVVDVFRRWCDEQAEEGLFLEFKTGKMLDFGKADQEKEDAARYNLAKAVASLANTEGGRVAVGIGELPGHEGYSRAGEIEVAPAEWRRDRVADFLDRDVSPRIERLEVIEAAHDGGKLFLVEVPSSYLGHQNRGLRASSPGEFRTRRSTGVSAPLDGREVRQLVLRSQLPDPVLALRLGEQGRNPAFDWQLFVVNRVGVLREGKATVLLVGDGHVHEPNGFRRLAGMPDFGVGGLVSVHVLGADPVYPGSPVVIGQLAEAARKADESQQVVGLLQAPGVEARLFAWSLAFVAGEPVLRPPSPMFRTMTVHDALGNHIPAQWMGSLAG